MVLILLLLIPALAAFAAWVTDRWSHDLPRWIAVAALSADLVIALALWASNSSQVGLTSNGMWLVEYLAPWIPQFGIGIHLAMDGLSLLLVILTAFLGLIAVGASWTDIRERVGFFHFNILWITTAILGVFLSLDLFLFYFFWEMMLIPMYFLIVLWGHERRVYASIKFFLFTQASGVLMLVSILGLVFVHGQTTGVYSFDYTTLLHTTVPPALGFWLMLGFLVAFAVKLPVFPFHTWLPDAHTEAPTAGSVILAGLMLKTGAYGMLRFVVPLFPQAALSFAPVMLVLGVMGILYGAMLSFSQTDLKRLVAYTSVSHMGFVVLGIFSWNTLALQGAVVEMIAHGISTGALFVLVGALAERIHTRDTREMGGLWATVPKMGAAMLFFAIASLGLPGLGNFVAEFLVLLGAFRVNTFLTALGTAGLILATVYALWMVQVAFHGENTRQRVLHDLDVRELAMVAAMVLVLVVLGLYPQPVINTANQALSNLQQITAVAQALLGGVP